MSNDGNADRPAKTDSPDTASEKNLTQTADHKEQPQAGAVDVIENMPPEVKRTFQAFMASIQSGVRPLTHPLFSKFTEAHIDKYLDYIQRDDDHAHQLEASNRWFYLVYFIMVLVTLSAAIVYLLPRDREFLQSIIQIIILVAGGIGTGYGLSKRGKRQ